MIRYNHLLSPLKLGNTVVKSRLFFPNALPHFQQGPENYPADPMITFYSDLARNGMAIVLYHHLANKDQRKSPNRDGRHFPQYDPEDYGVQNYICQLTDNISYYGGLAAVDLFYEMGRDMSVVDMEAFSEDDPLHSMVEYLKMLSGDENLDIKSVPAVFGMGPKKGFTISDMEDYISAGITQAKFFKSMGFNAGHVELARYSIFGSFLSPIKNTRRDEFGGSLENRMRFPLTALRRMREALGSDFLLIGEFSCQEEFGAPPVEEQIAFLKNAEPYIDLLHIRTGMLGSGYETTEDESLNPKSLEYCAKLKVGGIKIPIAAWTGYQDPALMDKAIADGKCDMISCARMFICNPDIGDMLEQGRGDDVVPCIKCNKCHGLSLDGEWVSACSVNPKLGLYSRIHRMVREPSSSKKIAVIGGGPAGMYAAKICAERGHRVTLFEAESELGGQLKIAKYPSFKWPVRQFVDFLVYQVGKQGVKVKLNTRATPEMISKGRFDAVFAATGAVPKKPDIPGAENTRWDTYNIYGKERELGRRVVCIGGSESATEAALYLAENGHKVTMLSRNKECAHDANPIHWKDGVQRIVKESKNVDFIPNAKTTLIEPGKVTYTDPAGSLHSIECDDIVAAGGVKPLQEEAMAFFGSAPYFRMIGDGRKAGDIRRCVREAFAAASQI